MERRYAEWIVARKLPMHPSGLCSSVTLEMQAAFPELHRVRGHVIDVADDQQYPHWWLQTDDGDIIDPTVGQFAGIPSIRYVRWREGTKEPTGKCHDCGGYVYDGSSFCSDDCARSTEAYLNSNRHALYLDEA